MNEEEIIDRLNKILEQWQKIVNIEDDIERDIEMSLYMEEMPFYEIKGILDLYQKEKEKNKELEEGLKYRVKYCGLLERELYGNENIELTKIEQELLEEE